MPILPENKFRYPKDWKEISHRIRFVRAKGRCEFVIDGKRCKARHGKPHPETGARVVLTTAHLDHVPENCADENLLAGCQRCHNRYDRSHRNETRRTKLDVLKGDWLFPPAVQMPGPVELLITDEMFEGMHE